MRGKLCLCFMLIVVFMSTITLAEEIKPGIVIDKANYKNYLPELKRLLTPSSFETVINGLRKGFITLPIVEKRKYIPPKGYVEATKKNLRGGKIKVTSDNRLIGWKAGMPFPSPKSGVELGWNYQKRCDYGDQMFFTCDFLLFNKDDNLERKMSIDLWQRNWNGRTDVSPIPEEPGNNNVVQWKDSFIFTYPFDARGFASVRTRYEDLYKDDDVYTYLPTIRRIRRFTGSDLTDPLLGTDDTMDDFDIWFQKINTNMSFKMREGKILVPVHAEKPPKLKGNCFQVEWEIRPVYILEVIMNDPTYIYSKRVIYIDKEDGMSGGLVAENYDQRGRLWRSWTQTVHAWDPNTRAPAWYGVLIKDHISEHSTVLWIDPVAQDPTCTPKKFNIRFLIRRIK